ncbi:GNAT family N-acetyltransferase [Salipaludibacillus aurantiacus]|uniref:Ribosomal-protein-alanine N-acetyltransferase n=1 Tax=Salipaludibacillus aurantiacus TaxID=1601833 RepID=A0A1H9WSV2_9BACI|nr:GNAT family N-acetyltransferase [Salipaludibacillus aurantiacus]SES37008.1 ribosomal-protein-alanine N-acetyltransferase [Salipaludibacillus aurantiacus]
MELIIYTKRLMVAACSPQFFPVMQTESYNQRPHISAHLNSLKKDPSLYGWGPWLILLRNNSRVIGDIGFKGKPDSKKSIEVGYGIITSERNRGYATEALEALVNWAFYLKNVKYITALCRHDNYSSIRVLEKIKMVRLKEEHQMIHWHLKANLKTPS